MALNASRTNLLAAGAALLAAAPLALRAAEGESSPWRVSVGPGVVVLPDYPGADDEDVLPIPAIDISYRNRLFLDTRSAARAGLGAYLVNGETRQVGASLGWRRGREFDDVEPVPGFEEIDDSAIARFFFIQSFGPLALSASLATALTENTGTTLDLSAAWRWRVSRATGAAFGVQGTFGNDTYMREWFGTDDGGVRSAGVFASVSRELTEAWSISASAAYDVLVSDAADSLIADREGMPLIAVSALYRFRP